MFTSIFRFELAYHLRQPLIYVMSAIVFLVSFLATVSDNVSIGSAISNININSPFNVIITLSSLSFITSLVAGVTYATSPVLRDFDTNIAELFFTTRVKKSDYLFARFCGATLVSFLVYFAALLGILLGEFMPWLDPERIGPLRLDAYWLGTWAIAIPNMLFVSTLVFFIATTTRSLMASYVVLVLMLVISSVVSTLVDPEDIRLLSLLDPFGSVALEDLTRYWTPFQRNELLVPITGNFLTNRLLIMSLALVFVGAGYRFFPFSLETKKTRSFSFFKAKKKSADASAKPALTTVTTHQYFDLAAQLQQFASLLRIEVHSILIGKTFLMMALIGMVQVGLGGYFGTSTFGTDLYPTTAALLRGINGGYSIPLMVVMIFYSSELLVREKNFHVSEMQDSMPYPNWVVIAAKISGLMLIMAIMMLAAIFAAVLVQIFKGYYDFQFGYYFLGLFSFFQFPIWFTCVLAVFAQVLTGNRYLGMFVVVGYFVATLFLPQQGFENNLYLFATPQVPLSVFTGFGPNLDGYLWYSLYWTLFCCLLVIAMHLLWQRGNDDSHRFAWSKIKARISKPVVVAASISGAGFIAVGTFIFYNTHVLNPYSTRLDQERLAADYEKAFKQYEELEFPDIVNFYSEVDIYPEEREAHIEGTYTLQNNYEFAIPELHFTVPAYLTINALDVPDSRLSFEDSEHGYYIYQLDSPMASGAILDVTFDLDWLTPGFVNSGPTTRLLSNGSFFNNTEAFPLPGYQKGTELVDNNRRRKFNLPPAERMAKIDDESNWDTGLGTRLRAGFETIVSTSVGQMAVSPGYLQRDWVEDDRHYFHYKMDEPIWPFVSFLSADYEMKSGQWNDVDIEVYYKHGVNVDRMIEASQKSLSYFTENFSPYQYEQYRIFEFPLQRGVFAQSFPNTIPFSEGIGFVADIRDPADIDYVFYVVAHELAHQWWGHQVVGGNVQGSAVLTETLSQYSALMVMEQEYGSAHMQRFLKYELDRYLNGRGAEVLEELPLMLAENQGYIHYRKGSLVMYALKDYLGEDVMNSILSDFIDEYGFKGPPYPTTKDLIAKIRQAAGPEHQSLISDLFEKIVLFDLRAEDSEFSQQEDGSFEVTVNVSAKKFEADGQGQETEVPVNTLIDIAVLGEKDPETDIPEVLFVEKREINSAEQSFVVRVLKEPVSIGIDPFNKMIDRNPDDNVKSVSEALN
ncbi:MAG: M1 family aminopeptidase [Pseudohongiellaceae bacterium]